MVILTISWKDRRQFYFLSFTEAAHVRTTYPLKSEKPDFFPPRTRIPTVIGAFFDATKVRRYLREGERPNTPSPCSWQMSL
jgi:hypothetical protein